MSSARAREEVSFRHMVQVFRFWSHGDCVEGIAMIVDEDA